MMYEDYLKALDYDDLRDLKQRARLIGQLEKLHNQYKENEEKKVILEQIKGLENQLKILGF